MQYYETQRAAAGSGAWTTFDSSSTNPLTATGLNPGTSYDFRQRAVDVFGNVGSYSTTASATTSTSADGNDGLIVSNYSSFDPDAAQIISLDINSSIPNWGTTGGGNVTFANETWWNGSSVPVATIFPPTVADRGSGLGGIDLWKNATKQIRQFNIRWETYVSDAFCGNNIGLPKLIIIRTYTQLQSVPTVGAERPMLFLAHMQEAGNANVDIADTLCLVPAQGTTRMFSSTNLVPGPTSADWVSGGNGPTTYGSCRQPFYYRATAGSDLGGNPILAASEIICIEMRVNVMSTADEPYGVIAYRVYRRSGGTPFERGCSWTWETGHNVGTNYIADIDTFGGGYYNNANSGAANLFTKMGRRITFGFNLQPSVGRAWIGPPQGFVQ